MQIRPVTTAQKPLLWKLLQAYLRELSTYYGDVPDERGVYPYRYFDHYFLPSEQNRRWAYLIFQDDTPAGFALINAYSYNGTPADCCMAEFTILPAFRRSGLAEAAAQALFHRHPGVWQLKYAPKNVPAAAFWRRITAAYQSVQQGFEGELLLTFQVNA